MPRIETPPPDEELLTLKDFAHTFQLHLKPLQRRAKSGRWPEAQMIGGRWYVLVSRRVMMAVRNTRVSAAS